MENKDDLKTPETEPKTDEPGAEVFEAPAVEPTPVPVREESRLAKFGRTLMKWMIVIGASFLAGVLVVYFAFFRPAMERLNNDIERWSTESQSMVTEIADLQGQIETLEPMEAENEQLSQEIDTLNLRVMILSVINDVTNASLSLERENTAEARVSLNNTANNLAEIREQLDPSMQQVVEDMESRLEITLDIMERDPEAALSDFSILTANLIKLENDLFLQP
ncbi:MAG: hypothetical protein EHM41_01755 [Chloroflexi bacterium]|nr:MAG: hypothetical protein EHM41_01755 [Chloroflexota bacterium]